MRAREALDDDVLGKIIASYREVGLYATAERLGIPRDRVNNAVKKARKLGWTVPHFQLAPLTREEIARRLEAYGRCGVLGAASELGVSPATMIRSIQAARKAGMPVPRCGRKGTHTAAATAASARNARERAKRRAAEPTQRAAPVPFQMPRFIDAKLAHRIIVAGLPLRSERRLAS